MNKNTEEKALEKEKKKKGVEMPKHQRIEYSFINSASSFHSNF